MSPYNTEKSASRYILVSLAVILFVTAMVLVILQSSYFRNLQTGFGAGNTYEDGYAKGFSRARDLGYASGLPRPSEKTVLTGTVESVDDSSVTFTLSGLVLDDAVDEAGLVRTAFVTKDTKITTLTYISPEENTKNQIAYGEKIRNLAPGSPLPTPPIPYVEAVASFTSLTPGDLITVTSVNGQDLIQLPTFYVSKMAVVQQ
ncbi:MAG TPA: hypothetical protein VN397_02575 [Candidatus Methylomirabilis sp.]|nr:hypothetical protein [Candidatus Methylomirabilis sp.]